jgi:hypothetical protein
MPYCPRCRAEYRDGFTRCADCNVDLSAKLPAAPEPTPEGWIEIFRGSDLQASVVCASLDDAGIDTVFPDQYLPSLGWYAPGSFNAIRVFIKAVDAARAREILAAPPAPPDA